MDFMDRIIDAAKELAQQNRERDENIGAVKSGPDITSGVALGMLFDGAEDLNTRNNRMRVHFAYRVAYIGRKV